MKLNAKPWLVAAAVTMALVLAGGVLPARAGVSDAWISTKVKMQLMNSPQVAGIPISVDTDQGRVTLHGVVASRAEKAEAERITTAATGVMSVRNLLQIVPTAQRKRVEVADDRVRSDVDAALKAEPALANSSIETKSVHRGVVLLSGKAATLSDHLVAVEVAAAVPGVRQVASEVESPSEFGDREIWNDDQAPADPAHGNRMTDGWITARTKMHFMTDSEIPSGDINVDTRRGVVTLFGTVPTAAAQARALRVTRDVPGVLRVDDELRVLPASQKKHATAGDDEVATAVRRRLSDADMTGADVKVEVKASTARLTGTVRHASQRYSAVSITHATPGVDHVEDDLRVEAPKVSTE